MTQITRLQLGTSRLEFLPDTALRCFLDKSWIHLGDAPDQQSVLRKFVRRVRLAQRGIRHPESLYERTTFKAFYYRQGDSLPFADDSLHFIFSEHFFEHLFFDEAMSLMRECYRVLVRWGVMRVSVPDADLRIYEKPEPAGFPSRRISFSHPKKHKTRWSVYMLSEALRLSGFEPVPIRFCNRDGQYIKNEPKLYDCCPEVELVTHLSYLRRPDSLIVDGVKH